MIVATSKRTRAFVSYAHRDKGYLERLHIHLTPFVRKENLDIWDDTRIKAGQKWKEEIQKAISLAKVAILLVSADFLASEFITENELPRLLALAFQEEVLIYYVYISTCAIQHTDLFQYQAVNPLSKPLKRMGYDYREEVWTQVVGYVRDAMKSVVIDTV
jgi:internalin A